MASRYFELRAKMSSEARALSEAKFRSMQAEMPLHELRRARGLLQTDLAAALHVDQPSIAKLEKRTDP